MGNKIIYKGYTVGETTQVSIMPTASVDNSGAIVQYVGATNANYINGRFYRCVSDETSTPTYSWEEVDMGTGEVVDAVTNGDMHAVTSNAVFNAITNFNFKGKSADHGVVNYNGHTYFVPEIYTDNLPGKPACILLAYVIGENNGMALIGVNSADNSGFSYVDGQFNNYEQIKVDGKNYLGLKMSNDENIPVTVMYLGKAW